MKNLWSLVCLLLFCAAARSPAAQVQTRLFDPVDAKRNRKVPLKVYLPATTEPCPVVLFSHGLGGSRNNNAYLGNYWAGHGYVAVFMQHPGSDESVWKNAERNRRFAALRSAASARAALDRLSDVKFVIDQLERWSRAKGHPLAGRLDLEHIGMCGHSFGAVTTLGVMGRKHAFNRSYADPRIDAFLPMSPQPGKWPSPEKAFGHIQAPVLCMTGTRDSSPLDSSMKPETRRKVYQALPPGDKYQLVLEGAEHSAFGDHAVSRRQRRNPRYHPAIQKLSTRFWDAYLKGDAKARAWLQSDAPRRDCGLVPGDVWEWK